MSSSYKAENGTVFVYNSDMSGEVRIGYAQQEIELPAEDLLEFVAYCYVGPQRVKELEEAHWRTLLGGA